MEKIFLKSGAVNGSEVSTSELIKIALDAPPEGGFKYRDYQERARVESAMEKTQSEILNGDIVQYFELETHDYNNLCKWVDRAQWSRRDPFLVEFVLSFQKK